MPFRPTFSCLWCGTAHTVRSPRDVEGWAQLCPGCIGRAGDNDFLRFRLRRALGERAASGRDPVSPDEQDNRYLRRGRFERGPLHDAAWNAELDAAGRWLDGLPIRGEIVELAAGTGWWSALLAGKGTLSVYDEQPASLDRARERLVAHRLRAHLHVRDRWTEPDRRVDALFIGPALAEIPATRLPAFLALARRWLQPGGLFAAIDLLPDPYAVAAEEPVELTHDPEALPPGLAATGFSRVSVASTGRFFTLASGRA